MGRRASASPTVTVALVADHIEHVVKIAGHDHVGIGGDLDGIAIWRRRARRRRRLSAVVRRADPARLERSRISPSLPGGNMLRALRRAESVASSMKDEPPSMATLEPAKAE